MNLMEGKERKKSNPNIGSVTDDPTKWSREPVFSKASPYDYDESSEDENGAELLARIQRKKSERQEILDKSMSLSFSKSHSNSISNSGTGNGCSLDESAQMLKAHDQGLINSMNVVSNQNAGFSKSFNTVTTPSQQQASSGQINGQKLMVSQSDKNINIGPNYAQNAKFVPPLELHSDNNSHNSSSRFNNSDTAFPTLYLPGNGKSLSGSYSNSDVESSPRDHEKSHFLSDKSGENTPKRNDLLSGVAAGYVYNNSGGSISGNSSNNDRVNHNNISINSANSSRKNSNSNISLGQIPSHPHPQGANSTQPKQARSIQRVVSVQNNNNSGGSNNSHQNYNNSNNSNVGSGHFTSGNTSGSRSPVGPMGTAEHFATNNYTSNHANNHANNHISHRDKLNKVDKLTENAQLNPSADIAKLISIGLSETEAIKVYNEHVNALNNQNKNAHISHSNSNNTHIAHNNINNSNSSSINYPTPLPTHRDSLLSIQVPSSRNPIDSYLDDIPIVSAPVPVNRNLAEERQAHEQQYRSHQNRHNHSSGRSLRRQNTDFSATAAANALNDINSGNSSSINSNNNNNNNTSTNSYNNSDNRVEYRGDSNSVSTSGSRRSSKNNNVINQNISNNTNSSGCGGGSGAGSGTVSRPYTANNIESVRINSRYNLNAASGSSSNLGEYYIAEQSPYHSRKNSLTHNMNSTTGLDRMLSQSANNTPRGGVSAQIKNVIAGNEALSERDLITMSMSSYGLSESEWDSGSNNSSFYSSFSQNSNANTYNNNQLLSAAVQYANHNRSMSSMNNLSPHSPHPGHGIGFNTSGRNSNLSNQDSNNSNNDDNSPPRIRLSHSADEMAFQLGLLLSKQDAAFGINMFSDTNLIESNEVEINAMMSAGYAKEHAIQMIFERIYGTCE